MTTRLKVSAPASIANLSVGYDILGVAVDICSDEILGRLTETSGIHISKITGDKKKLPLDWSKNTAGVAIQHFLDKIDRKDQGIDIEIRKKIGIGTGLGSSASSACAAVVLANELLGRPLDKKELLDSAIIGESAADGAIHGDNVAPCLLGGIQLVSDSHQAKSHRVIAPDGLYFTIVTQAVELLTSESREVLSPELSLKKHIKQSANLGGFLLGLQRHDFPLIKSSLVDVIIEPQRAHLVPNFRELQELALQENALGCSISGAGPAIFALSQNSYIASLIEDKWSDYLTAKKVEYKTYLSPINHLGTVKC